MRLLTQSTRSLLGQSFFPRAAANEPDSLKFFNQHYNAMELVLLAAASWLAMASVGDDSCISGKETIF